MVSSILFWTGFGVAVRFWQLCLVKKRHLFFKPPRVYALPVFIGAGASFGYWLEGVEQRQKDILLERKRNLLEKRRRRAEREGMSDEEGIERGGVHDKHGDVLMGGGQV